MRTGALFSLVYHRHPSQRRTESARNYHARAHGMLNVMEGRPVPFEECPGYPCRTHRVRGWLSEVRVGIVVRCKR
jgi:hypothetical protein